MKREERFNEADNVIKIGFWVNAALMVVKLAAGYWGRAESIAAAVVSFVILGTGAWILFGSVSALLAGDFKSPSLLSVGAALSTIAVKESLFRCTKKAGDLLGSPSLSAMAKDQRKDAATSIATLVGVSGAFFGFGFMNPLAADPGMTVKESRDVGLQVKKLIFEHDHNVGDVMIHVNPRDEDHEDLIRL
jgi:divalent metal cation (Fe/Co/Zn/Cd) transporter